VSVTKEIKSFSTLTPDVLQPRVVALARAEGRHQEAEVREDQREEDVDARRGPLQGIPGRVRHVLELLPRAQI